MNIEILDDSSDKARPHPSVRWWESRRMRYNLIVLVPGLFTFFVLLMINGEALPLLIGTLFYGIAANICYCAGMIVEQLEEYYSPLQPMLHKFRTVLYIIGVLFSVFITVVPGLIGLAVRNY